MLKIHVDLMVITNKYINGQSMDMHFSWFINMSGNKGSQFRTYEWTNRPEIYCGEIFILGTTPLKRTA